MTDKKQTTEKKQKPPEQVETPAELKQELNEQSLDQVAGGVNLNSSKSNTP